MTDPRDDERQWHQLWTGDPAPADVETAGLARRARAEQRRMRWTATLEAAVSLPLLALIGGVLLEHHDPLHLVWGIGAAAAIIAAWGFQLVTRRAVYAPFSATTDGFVAIMIERCRRRMRATRVVSVIALGHLALTLGLAGWTIGSYRRGGPALHPADAAAYSAAVLVAVVATLWGAWYRTRTRARLAELTALRQSSRQT